jgi:hypothetical protein
VMLVRLKVVAPDGVRIECLRGRSVDGRDGLCGALATGFDAFFENGLGQVGGMLAGRGRVAAKGALLLRLRLTICWARAEARALVMLHSLSVEA